MRYLILLLFLSGCGGTAQRERYLASEVHSDTYLEIAKWKEELPSLDIGKYLEDDKISIGELIEIERDYERCKIESIKDKLRE